MLHTLTLKCFDSYIYIYMFSHVDTLFIYYRLVVSSEEAQNKDTRTHMKGMVLKATDMLAKAKVYIVYY